MNRAIVRENLNMAWHFVIRMYNIAPWVLLRCIYSIDIMSKRSHGGIFLIDCHGIQRSCLQKQSNVHEQIASHSHREVCNTVYKKARCKYLNGTHTGRHEGCKLADMLGVPVAHNYYVHKQS